jgi:N-acetylmuramoyl-L-alanine amidase
VARIGVVVAALAAVTSSAVAQEPVEPRGSSGSEGAYEVVRERGYEAIALEQLEGRFLASAKLEGPVLRAIVAGQPLVLQVGSPFLRYGMKTYQLANPPYMSSGGLRVPRELVSEWWPRLVAAGGPGAGNAAVAEAPRRPGPFRVVIDPGHGGKDPGTTGRNGTREKHVVLAIARKMYERLKDEPGVEPVLTRERDVFIGLRERSSFAVEREADLFVSVHANWSSNRNATGFETYFLSAAKTEAAREVAMRENASVQYENGESYAAMSDLDFILAGLDRNENVRESSRVAGYAQNALRRVRGTPDRGVKQAGFWVLVGASGTMPTVLVEVGFLSNPDEERVLRSDAGQQQVADSLAEGILTYRRLLDDRYRGMSAGSQK